MKTIMRPAEIAALLGVSIDTFNRNLALYEAQGMPRPFVEKPRRLYDARAIDYWMLSTAPPKAIAAIMGDQREAVDQIADWESELASRVKSMRPANDTTPSSRKQRSR